MDVAAWLHGLGLQQYEQAFRENAIDDAVLLELTADDLKDLGDLRKSAKELESSVASVAPHVRSECFHGQWLGPFCEFLDRRNGRARRLGRRTCA